MNFTHLPLMLISYKAILPLSQLRNSHQYKTINYQLYLDFTISPLTSLFCSRSQASHHATWAPNHSLPFMKLKLLKLSGQLLWGTSLHMGPLGCLMIIQRLCIWGRILQKWRILLRAANPGMQPAHLMTGQVELDYRFWRCLPVFSTVKLLF